MWGNWGQAVYKLIKGINHTQKARDKSSEGKYWGISRNSLKKVNLSKRRRQWHPTPVLSPGKSHGWRILVGCSPWGCEELDTTDRLHFHFSLSCIGEGNGNPLQCSCLENPKDREAWWAAIYGVAQSRTQLKRLSSSSSSSFSKTVEITEFKAKIQGVEEQQETICISCEISRKWLYIISMVW